MLKKHAAGGLRAQGNVVAVSRTARRTVYSWGLLFVHPGTVLSAADGKPLPFTFGAPQLLHCPSSLLLVGAELFAVCPSIPVEPVHGSAQPPQECTS